MTTDHMEPTHVMSKTQWEITRLRPVVEASEKMIRAAAVKSFNDKFKSAVAQKESNEKN